MTKQKIKCKWEGSQLNEDEWGSEWKGPELQMYTWALNINWKRCHSWFCFAKQ